MNPQGKNTGDTGTPAAQGMVQAAVRKRLPRHFFVNGVTSLTVREGGVYMLPTCILLYGLVNPKQACGKPSIAVSGRQERAINVLGI